jgi:hypothetical protein
MTAWTGDLPRATMPDMITQHHVAAASTLVDTDADFPGRYSAGRSRQPIPLRALPTRRNGTPAHRRLHRNHGAPGRSGDPAGASDHELPGVLRTARSLAEGRR